MTVELNFVRQQGFRDASPGTCTYQYLALMWQPRIIGVLVLAGLALQSWLCFVALGIVLWWSAALPGLNPFDHLYSAVVARPKGLPPLGAAPSPRRFAQFMAGGFTLGIGLALPAGRYGLAWSLEAVLLVPLAALVFGRFCLGSYLFLLLTGQASYANKTLPWVRTRPSRST